MAKQAYTINSFRGGEISPRLDGRADLDFYYSSCKQLDNAYVYPHGGTNKRPGTKYIATAGDSSNKVRLIPFQFSTTQAYVLELGEYYMRFYKDGGQVTVSGAAVEVVTPWPGDDLFEIKYSQTADTMYLVHPDYKPQVLSRFSDSTWTLEDIDFTGGPFLDQNTTNTTITPSAVTGSGITLTASTGIFESTHVGSTWQLKGDITETKTVNSDDDWTDTLVLDTGDSLLFDVSGSSWSATIYLQKSYDEGTTWTNLVSTTSNYSVEVTSTEDNVYFRAGTGSGWSSGNLSVKIIKRDQRGWVNITDYVSDTVVSGTVTRTLANTNATKKWSEGAWSDKRGYPSCVVFSKQRTVMAGTDYQPQTYWASKVDDYNNFDVGNSNDDDGVAFTIASDEVNKIRWLAEQRVLLAGTTGGEWRLTPLDEGITPTNPSVSRQTSYGSQNIQPVRVGHTICYIQNGGNKLRDLYYEFKVDSFVSNELSLKAEHLLREGKVVDMTYAARPDSIIYMVQDTGEIKTCTHDPLNQVLSFSSYTTEGYFESVTSIHESDDDEVWVVVKRNINDSDVRYIEKFSNSHWTSQNDYIYMDSTITYSGTATTTLSGADHLIGEECSVLTSGAVHDNITVSGGGIVHLQEGYEGTGNMVYHVGLPYTTTLKTTRINSKSVLGSALGKQQAQFDISLNVYNSFNIKMGSSATDLEYVYDDNQRYMDTAPEPYTGMIDSTFPAGYDDELFILLVSDTPAPMTILNINTTVKTADT